MNRFAKKTKAILIHDCEYLDKELTSARVALRDKERELLKLQNEYSKKLALLQFQQNVITQCLTAIQIR